MQNKSPLPWLTGGSVLVDEQTWKGFPQGKKFENHYFEKPLPWQGLI